MRNSRKFSKSAQRYLTALVAVTLGCVAYMGQMSTSHACDACNKAFFKELQEERANTPLGKDFARTLENHSRFDVLNSDGSPDGQGQSSPSADGAGQALHLAQAGGTDGDRRATAGLPQGALAQAGSPQAALVNPNPNDRDFDEIYADEQFIDIIERDENLPNTPPTGYVPQDVEPDKEFTITLDEGKTYLGQGVIYDGFLTSGAIPGPTMRVQQGDIVKFNVENTGTVPHGASIHAAYTQTSAYVGQIDPGETKSVTFRATYPGVFMYHCAPGGHAIPMHVMAGQYGMIVVEPEQQYKLEEELGQEPDLSLYIVQNEVYANGKDAVEANPAYAAFNGQPFRYVEDPIAVEPGDYVRIYYLNVGPNLLSTFHFVGIIWDYVYWQGHPEARLPGGQTVTAGPSDSFVIEFRIPPDEGVYTMLTHVVGYATRGAIGLFAAEEGAEGPDVILADGPTYTEEEIQELTENATRVIAPFKPGSRELQFPERYGSDVDEVVVSIKGNSYNPAVIEIEEGTKVTWINDEVFGYLDGEFSGIHNAVGTSGPVSFATDMLAHSEQDSIVFDEPGEYEYICTPHPYMEGKIIVRPSEDEEEEEATGCSSTAQSGGAGLVAVVLMLCGLAAIRRRRRAS